MKNKTKHIIKTIEPGSIAEELELEPGDELLRVNGEIIEDVFDYHFQTNDTYLELTIRKKDGEEWDLEIEKEYDEEIGITFENEFMDQYRSCSNNCIFCFIDQMPPGMRPTLYFKDDDSRLSFLQGNYITLTNMSDHDIDRIIRYHLAPINISFQTTNPELRCKMLHNRFAGNIFPKVQRLYEAGIEMNGQIVLCKGYNDGAELERSISDLSKYLPHLKSVSVVPVGLSKYRDGLAPLEPFTREDAKEVLATIHKWQKKLYEQGQEKNRLGLLSKYNLNQLEIAAKQAQDNVALLETSMEQLYIKLNDLMGEKADARFEYVYDVTYTPYKLSLPMEQYLNAALKKDLTIQLKELALDSAKFTKNYVGESNTRLDSNTQEYNYDTAKRNLKTAKTDKEMAIRNAYLQLQQMETQITSAQSSLTKAQADYRAAQINLRAGNVTKTAVEQAEMGVVSAQNSLNQLIYNYDMLVFTFENPSLLGNTTQAQ